MFEMLFGKTKKKHHKSDWVWIGTAGYHDEDRTNVPEWLLKRTRRGESGYFKGRTFIYKVVYSGGREQGDGHCIYYRKLRRKD